MYLIDIIFVVKNELNYISRVLLIFETLTALLFFPFRKSINPQEGLYPKNCKRMDQSLAQKPYIILEHISRVLILLLNLIPENFRKRIHILALEFQVS
jgi:hypothetical protein